jgi:CRP-like cAMP-binding protein
MLSSSSSTKLQPVVLKVTDKRAPCVRLYDSTTVVMIPNLHKHHVHTNAHLQVLQRLDFFGEIALVKEIRRACDVRAAKFTEMCVLTK